MEKNSVSLDRLSEIFEMLLKTAIIKREYTVGSACAQPETVVSSIDYTGAMNGTVYMLLRECDIDSAYKAILKRFDARHSPEYGVVFSEFLNIFSGHLVTEYGKNGVHLNITPPGEYKTLPGCGEWHVVTLTSDLGIVFKFVFARDTFF